MKQPQTVLIFRSGAMQRGTSARDCLRRLTSTWLNPDTVAELRISMMRRANVGHLDSLITLSDHDFVMRMSEPDIGWWTVKKVR